MKDAGFDLFLASIGADSDAQHFWRKMGYIDCGSLNVRDKPTEIFLQRPV